MWQGLCKQAGWGGGGVVKLTHHRKLFFWGFFLREIQRVWAFCSALGFRVCLAGKPRETHDVPKCQTQPAYIGMLPLILTVLNGDYSISDYDPY